MRKCHRCGADLVEYVELWIDHVISFSTDTDGVIREDGILNPGSPYAVEAVCQNGHRWKMRGVTQITDISECKAGIYGDGK